jgi:hypothetical protein
MQYDASLEIAPDGRTLAQIPELPGCFARAGSESEAINNLRVAVPDYFRWLSMQDAETPTMSGDVELVVRERFAVTPPAGAFFASDATPVSDDDLGWLLALMSYAHMDLLRYTTPLSFEILTWSPVHGSHTIDEILDHLAQTEMTLATRLEDQPNPPTVASLTGTSLNRYDTIHEQAMMRYSAVTPEQCEAIREVGGERWSLRRMLRTSIQHEREHTEQIALIIATYTAR